MVGASAAEMNEFEVFGDGGVWWEGGECHENSDLFPCFYVNLLDRVDRLDRMDESTFRNTAVAHYPSWEVTDVVIFNLDIVMSLLDAFDNWM